MKINYISQEKKKVLIGFLIVFVFYFLLAYLSPMTMDDWVWGTSTGIERLQSHFNNYNGRYLGNITIIFLTRSVIAKSLFMGLVNTLIILLINKIVWNEFKFKNIFIVFILISIMPISIFSQTYAWASGFSNYNMAVLFTLFNISMFKDLLFNKKEVNGNPIRIYFLICFSGIAGQLFAEHVTIYNFIFAVFVFLISLIKKKQILKALFFLISTTIGTIIMFSNSSYSSVVTGQDSYRSIAENTSLLSRIYSVFTQYMFDPLIFNNTLLNFIISLLFIFILTVYCRKSLIKNFFVIYLTIFPLYKLLVYHFFDFSFPIKEEVINTINSSFSFIYIIIIGLSILLFINKDKEKLLFFLISFAIISSPLFFVTPLSSRTFFSSYIFLVLFAATCIEILDQSIELNYLVELKSIFLGIVILLMSSYMLIFVHIHRSYDYRTAYIQNELLKDEKEITLWRIPNDQFVYGSTPLEDSYMEKNFKKFYKIPNDVILERK